MVQRLAAPRDVESAVMGRGASLRGKSEGGDKLVVLPGLPVAQGSSVRVWEGVGGAVGPCSRG
jgi:hypothetical protein